MDRKWISCGLCCICLQIYWWFCALILPTLTSAFKKKNCYYPAPPPVQSAQVVDTVLRWAAVLAFISQQLNKPVCFPHVLFTFSWSCLCVCVCTLRLGKRRGVVLCASLGLLVVSWGKDSWYCVTFPGRHSPTYRNLRNACETNMVLCNTGQGHGSAPVTENSCRIQRQKE